MKLRNGFVSNSSSSSFIVAFPRVPKTPEEMREILFGDRETYPNPYPDYSGVKSWPSSEIAEIVFRDMGEPLSDKQARAECEWSDESPDSLIREKGKGSALFLFTYSDNRGALGSAMEHGDLFDRLPHIRISNH